MQLSRLAVTARPAGFLILGAFLLVVLIVDPRGNFPLNDDWNFALATWWFAEHGEFRFATMTGMSLHAQVLYGALWTKLFGSSFDALRASTLTLAFCALVVFDRLAIRSGLSGFSRVLAVLALLAHPIFMWSSFTYMTHIPFLLTSMIALLGFIKGAQENDLRWFLCGTIATLAACFIRQNGILLLAAGLSVVIVTWRDNPRRSRAAAFYLVTAAAVFAVLFLASDVLRGRPEEFETRFELFDGGLQGYAARVLRHVAFFTQYYVVCVIGLAVAAARRMARRHLAAVLLITIPIAWGVSEQIFGQRERMAENSLFPYELPGNVIAGAGLGPPNLRDVWVLGYPQPRALPPAVRWGLTIATALLGSFLILEVVRAFGEHVRARPPTAASVAAVALVTYFVVTTAAYIVTSVYFFDRYVLDAGWTLPLLLIQLAQWTPARRRVAFVLTVVLLVFSMGGTSDYLAWNRARWDAFGWLKERGVPLSRMDGGYEINQYLVGGFDGPQRLAKPGFSVRDDEWILTFQAVAGYDVIESVSYSRWSGSGTILILRRSNPPNRRTEATTTLPAATCHSVLIPE